MATFEFVHAGVVVNNLKTTAQFFVDRGDPFEVGGSWMDRIIGLEGTRVEGIMVTTRDGGGKLELIKFHEPTRVHDQTDLPADAHGYGRMAFQVTDIDAVVAQARTAGYDTVGEVVDF